MGRSRRLFVGAFPPAETASAVHRAVRGALDGAAVRLVPAEEIHLTLCFLGATDEARIPDLVRALERGIQPLSGPDTSIRGTGAFPDESAARVLWVGLSEANSSPGRLAVLAGAARSAARASGLLAGEEEPWSAHLTVARPARGRLSLPDTFRRLSLELPWRLDEVRLLESRPGASGPERFPVLASFAFRRESM